VNKPFSATKPAHAANKPSGTKGAKPESVRSILRSLGLVNLRLKISIYVVLSLIGAVSQAVLLLVISEVALADVEGKHAFHGIGPTLTARTALFVLCVVFPLTFIVSICSTLVNTSISEQALRTTRIRLVDGYFKSNWALQSSQRLGHLQHLLVQNSGSAGGVIGSLTGGIQSLFMMLALLGVALAVDPAAAIAVVAIGFVLLQLLRPLNRRAKRMNRELSQSTRAMATRATEYSRLARDFRLFGVEDRILDMLRGMIRDTGRIYRRASINGSIAPILYQTFSLGIVVAIVLIGSGHAQFAKNGFVLILVMRGIGYGAGLQSSIQGIRSSQGMLEDLMFDVHQYDENRVVADSAPPTTFEVDFNSVEYSYDGVTLALRGTTMHIPAGKIVGMLGPSGSGKTTISQLLLGLRSPSSGHSTMGGVDAAAISKSDAHNTVALVPQEPVLLQGSITDNINFFRDFEDHEVIEASKLAHLHEDVARMPEGYGTFVGEGGGALSGGQKQRLAIARALIGTPKLIVLDEPTSAVDGRTEKLIRQTLSALRGHVTVVIISHRIETTAQCDLLLVLSEGKIADFGEREEVLAGPAYQSIVLTRNDFSAGLSPGNRPAVLTPMLPLHE
jgi:ATP-binding cassette subfamily B protein